MVSPADLLEMAEAFADRIPGEPAYEEERAVIWLMIGDGHLRCGNAEAGLRALRALPQGRLEAEFRCTFAKWALAHPHSDVGRDVLRETVADLERLDPWLYARDLQELALITGELLGAAEAQRLAECVPEMPEELLALAKQAKEKSDAVVALAQGILGSKESLPEVADMPADSLERYLTYRYNDLKVRWLVDRVASGGLDHPELEARLSSDEFQRVEPPRQPNIHRNPSNLNPAEFADFLFARPMPLVEADKKLLQGEYYTWDDDYPDKTRMVLLSTQLFLDFEAVGRRYSQRQIDQGLWFLFGYPFWLGDRYLEGNEVPLEQRLACLEAMIVPFRDYLQRIQDDSGFIFYMWWDHVRMEGPETVPIARRVLAQILQLEGWPCQKAALHGLNHLRPDREASAIVARFLDEHGASLNPEDFAYAEDCRDGQAQ